MKMPTFSLPKFGRPKKKLRASTARRSLGNSDEMDYEEMSEPNMKLSRALLIVLVLHVVAVAGIIAFNTIKGRQGAFPPPKATASAAPVAAASSAPVKTDSTASTASNQTSALVAAKAAPKEEKIPKAMPVNTDAGGNFYVVAKGDNPVKIAKKLKVSESDLLMVNHIDDPRKLQIGQKLIVPQKKSASAQGKKPTNE
jgi:LysM repeat protein